MTKAVHPIESYSSEPAGFYLQLDRTTHQNKSQKEVKKYNGEAQLPADRFFLFSGNAEIVTGKAQVIASSLVVYDSSWPTLNG